jgi:hypothetical protein
MGKELQFKILTPEEAIEQIKERHPGADGGCLEYLKGHLEKVEMKGDFQVAVIPHVVKPMTREARIIDPSSTSKLIARKKD